jgi:hypothetical protein
MEKQTIDEEYYKSLLKQHDWFYEYSDDIDVYRRGVISHKLLIDNYQDNIKLQSLFWGEYNKQTNNPTNHF